MTDAILGIDLAKRTFDAALLKAGKTWHKVFPNRAEGVAALATWLAKHGVTQVHAGLEATGTSGEALAVWLHEAGHRVSLVNPARIQAFGKSELGRTKTDKGDAALIARFCQSQAPAAWTPPAPEVRELQALVRRRDAVQVMRDQEGHRLTEGRTASPVIASLTAHLQFLDEELTRLEALIRDHIARHPGLKTQRDLLVSIPGLGDRTAAKFLAEIVDWRLYASARQLAAYIGVPPRQRLSGATVRGRTRLAKTGNARLRRALYLPAVVATRWNPVIKAWCDGLRARGKSKMAVIGAVMRKLAHIAYGVLKSGRPFDPRHAMTA